MDSKAKPDVRLTGMRTPEARLDVSKAQRVNRWLIGAAVALAVALVAVGTWAIVDRPSEAVAPPPTIGLADAATVQMIDDLHEAVSTDGERFASFFTEDGVFEEHTDHDAVTEGREKIAALLQYYIDLGWHAERIGQVTQWGNFAAHAQAGPEGYTGMAIYELASGEKIRHMWVFGDYT